MSRRTERLASTIRQEVAMMIMRDLNDPRIKMMPSITRVKVTDDLEFADLYVTIMGTPGEQTAALNALKHASGLMRQKLSKMLDIRTVPFLRFQYDEAQKKELEMLRLLHKIELERQEEEARKAATTPAPADAPQTPEAEPADDAAGSPGAQSPSDAPAASDQKTPS